MAKEKRVTVLLDEEDYRKLKLLAAKTDTSMSEYLRREVKALLQREYSADNGR